MTKKAIVIRGDPGRGFGFWFIGPFKNFEAADTWVTNNPSDLPIQHISSLTPPEELERVFLGEEIPAGTKCEACGDPATTTAPCGELVCDGCFDNHVTGDCSSYECQSYYG